MTRSIALALALAIGCHQAMPPNPPTPTNIDTKVCRLHEFPVHPRKPVGFPQPDGIFMSTSDWAAMDAYLYGLEQWAADASKCLEGMSIITTKDAP